MSAITKEALESIVNSLFLPPKLPQEALPDNISRSEGAILLSLVRDAAVEYQRHSTGLQRDELKTIVKMLSIACKLQEAKSFSKEELMNSISSMESGGPFSL